MLLPLDIFSFIFRQNLTWITYFYDPRDHLKPERIHFPFQIYIIYLYGYQTTDIPTSAYFDWQLSELPLSILMAYVHVLLWSFLLLVADVAKHGGDIRFWRKRWVLLRIYYEYNTCLYNTVYFVRQ